MTAESMSRHSLRRISGASGRQGNRGFVSTQGAVALASLSRPVATFPVVERRRLLDRITASVERVPLTLISAPAGFGKTVLASDWAGRRDVRRPTAWLTLTDRDDQAAVIWAHVQLALAMVGAVAAEPLTAMFPGPADADALADQLLQLSVPVVLVLDAVERVRERGIFDQLARLLASSGDRLRVVMTSRADPALPLHRYRVEDTVAEIRAPELAFTAAEVRTLLGPGWSSDHADEVVSRTEGWAAGVRLAALELEATSMTRDGFADDYLRAEVVDTLTAADRDLLCRLSIVEDIPTGLAAALTGRDDAEKQLRRLSFGNGFVQPMPRASDGYRIHPLARRVLTAELREAGLGAVGELHRRAVDWFVGAGLPDRAVTHACAIWDWKRAASLTVRAWHITDIVLGTPVGREAGKAFAAAPDVDDLDVQLVRTAVELANRRFDDARVALERCRTFDLASPEQVVTTAALRVALEDAAGDGPAALRALAELRELMTAATPATGAPDSAQRLTLAMIGVLEGWAYLRTGDHPAAMVVLEEAAEASAECSHRELELRALGGLALAASVRGFHRCGLAWAQTAQRLETAVRPAAAGLARAWIAIEQQELRQAQHELDQVTRAREIGGDRLLTGVAGLLRARLMRDRGDAAGARAFIDRLRSLGSLDDWLAELLELELGTVSGPRNTDPIGRLLDRAAEECSAGTTRVAAVAAVAEALALAEPEHVRRPFAHIDAAVRGLIRNDPRLRGRAAWLRPDQTSAHSGTDRGQASVPVVVTEALSQRELEVLRHLSALMTTEEIAAEMFISVNTVRTHVRRVLAKLAVSRRNEAVRRGRELGLI